MSQRKGKESFLRLCPYKRMARREPSPTPWIPCHSSVSESGLCVLLAKAFCPYRLARCANIILTSSLHLNALLSVSLILFISEYPPGYISIPVTDSLTSCYSRLTSANVRARPPNHLPIPTSRICANVRQNSRTISTSIRCLIRRGWMVHTYSRLMRGEWWYYLVPPKQQ